MMGKGRQNNRLQQQNMYKTWINVTTFMSLRCVFNLAYYLTKFYTPGGTTKSSRQNTNFGVIDLLDY